jgi:hypothetical protein
MIDLEPPPPDKVAWKAKAKAMGSATPWMTKFRGQPVLAQTWYVAMQLWSTRLGIEPERLIVEQHVIKANEQMCANCKLYDPGTDGTDGNCPGLYDDLPDGVCDDWEQCNG